LAAAGFVKAFGITFLAIPRSDEAARAHEAPVSMRIGMGLLVFACILLGLTPTLILPLLGRVVAGIGGLPVVAPTFSSDLSLQMPAGFAQISPALVALGLLVVLGLAPLVMIVMRVNRRLRVSDTWGCGRVGQTPRMEYTSTSFAEPLRRVFAELYRPTRELTVDVHPDSKYFVQSIEYKSDIRSWFDEFLYTPLLNMTQWISRRVRRLQSGSLHDYVGYLFVMLILMLVALLWTGQ
jgi:NADH:ubiquinone oxidoreductase subunit 5 (subunit L)/multisubunit Na+/H+ antiporter MnhA subunit